MNSARWNLKSEHDTHRKRRETFENNLIKVRFNLRKMSESERRKCHKHDNDIDTVSKGKPINLLIMLMVVIMLMAIKKHAQHYQVFRFWHTKTISIQSGSYTVFRTTATIRKSVAMVDTVCIFITVIIVTNINACSRTMNGSNRSITNTFSWITTTFITPVSR